MAKKHDVKSSTRKTKSESSDESAADPIASPQQDALPPGIVRTQDDLRKAFCVSIRTVQNWVRDGMPVNPDGTYSIADVQAWRYAKELQRQDREGDETDKKIKDIKYKRELMQLKQMEGELISREDIELELIQISIAMKRRFVALIKSLPLQLYGQEKKEIHLILDKEFKQVAEEFNTGKIFEKVTRADIKKAKKTTKMDQIALDLD